MDSKGPDLRRSTAINELAPNSAYNAEADGTIIEWLTPDVPQPSEADIDAKVAELKAEYDAQEYARKREAEYPSLQECVHAILDDTLDALQAKRAEIKTKYPKGG